MSVGCLLEQDSWRFKWVIAAMLLLVCSISCLGRGPRYQDFTTPTPLGRNDILILGFLGGREPWNNDHHCVRRLALKLRSMKDVQDCAYSNGT